MLTSMVIEAGVIDNIAIVGVGDGVIDGLGVVVGAGIEEGDAPGGRLDGETDGVSEGVELEVVDGAPVGVSVGLDVTDGVGIGAAVGADVCDGVAASVRVTDGVGLGDADHETVACIAMGPTIEAQLPCSLRIVMLTSAEVGSGETDGSVTRIANDLAPFRITAPAMAAAEPHRR